MNVEAIKAVIEQLPKPDRRRLADWLDDLEERAWDTEIERDFSAGGGGTQLLHQVEQEIAEGKARPIQEGFARRRKPGV
jgi:hypothetical protein